MPALPPPIDRTPLLRGIGPGLRRAMLEFYLPDSCIAATRIAIDLLGELEIPARALAVRAAILNLPMVQLVERHGRFPNGPEERARWFEEAKAAGVGLGYPDPSRADVTPEANGIHTVAIVEERFIWDLSIDQATRPQYGIVIPEPLIAPIPKPKLFLSGREPLPVHGVGGVVVRYDAQPTDRRYTRSPNWASDGRDAELRARLTLLALRGIQAGITAGITRAVRA
jgi:hypothetical protein